VCQAHSRLPEAPTRVGRVFLREGTAFDVEQVPIAFLFDAALRKPIAVDAVVELDAKIAVYVAQEIKSMPPARKACAKP